MYIPKLSPPNGRYNTNILPFAVVSPAEQQDQHDNMINTGSNIRQYRCHKRFAHSAHPNFQIVWSSLAVTDAVSYSNTGLCKKYVNY